VECAVKMKKPVKAAVLLLLFLSLCGGDSGNISDLGTYENPIINNI